VFALLFIFNTLKDNCFNVRYSLNKINHFLFTNKTFFAFFVITFLSASISGISKINIKESIFATLPKGESFAKLSRLIEDGDLSNQIVFAIRIQNTEEEKLAELSSACADSLNKYAAPYLKDITINRSDVQTLMYDHF